MDFSIDPEQRLYRLSSTDAVGFDYARDHSRLIASRLQRTDLAPRDEDYGQPAGLQKFYAASQAWQSSILSRQTFFPEGTAPEAAAILERYRISGRPVRLFLGCQTTGTDWCEDSDTVGHISRSAGPLRLPLLLQSGESYGRPIPGRAVVRVMDLLAGQDAWRHARYQVPDLRVAPCQGTRRGSWQVLRGEAALGHFRSTAEAAEYAAFLRGELPLRQCDLPVPPKRIARAA